MRAPGSDPSSPQSEYVLLPETKLVLFSIRPGSAPSLASTTARGRSHSSKPRRSFRVEPYALFFIDFYLLNCSPLSSRCHEICQLIGAAPMQCQLCVT